MVTIGTASIARWKNADRMSWQAIVAFAIRTHTSLPVPQKAGAQRNAAFASSSNVTRIFVMSAFGPKRTSLVALHMSAFGGGRLDQRLTNGRETDVDSPIRDAKPDGRTHTREVPHIRAAPHRPDIDQLPLAAAL